jgi:hypothetical protein
LTPPADPDALAQAVLRLLRDVSSPRAWARPRQDELGATQPRTIADRPWLLPASPRPEEGGRWRQATSGSRRDTRRFSRGTSGLDARLARSSRERWPTTASSAEARLRLDAGSCSWSG